MINLNAYSALPISGGGGGAGRRAGAGGGAGGGAGAAWSDKWKVLVYDAPCRSVISPLLSVCRKSYT